MSVVVSKERIVIRVLADSEDAMKNDELSSKRSSNSAMEVFHQRISLVMVIMTSVSIISVSTARRLTNDVTYFSPTNVNLGSLPPFITQVVYSLVRVDSKNDQKGEP